MDAVFKKMNFKEHENVIVLNAPESFHANMEAMKPWANIKTNLRSKQIEFVVAFVTEQKEIDNLVPKIIPKLKDDALVWFCYPKKSSKNYTCNFNRDTGWEIMGKYDMEGVRMVAVDADWSALRFRNVKHIKTMTRAKGWTLSKAGKAKTTGK